MLSVQITMGVSVPIVGVIEQVLQPERQGEHLRSAAEAVSSGRCLQILLLSVRPDDQYLLRTFYF